MVLKNSSEIEALDKEWVLKQKTPVNSESRSISLIFRVGRDRLPFLITHPMVPQGAAAHVSPPLF